MKKHDHFLGLQFQTTSVSFDRPRSPSATEAEGLSCLDLGIVGMGQKPGT